MLHTPAPRIVAQPAWHGRPGQPDNIRVLDAYEVLFYEGDDADDLYEIIDGVVRVYKIFADGRRQIISFGFAGDLIGFGESGTYRFECDTLTAASIRAIPRASLLREVRDRPELGEKLLSVAVSQIATVQDLSILLCRKSAMERVAVFLLNIARRPGAVRPDGTIALPMTRLDIGDHLGLTIETVSRNFSKLRARGVIGLPAANCFEIRNLDRLEELADAEETIH